MPPEPKGLRKRRGIWYAVLRVDGRQREESTRSSDLREARAYRARRLRELAEGAESRDRWTLERYALESWAPERATTIRSWRDEERWLRKWILPALGQTIVGDLRPQDVATWIVGLRASGLAARSVRNAHSVLVALLAHAEFHESVRRNPATAARLPSKSLPLVGRSKEPAFTRAQARALVSDPEVEWSWRIVYAIAAFTGARCGEAVGRRWRDLQAREPLAALRIASQYNDEPLKGARDEDTAERLAPVHPELGRILDEWRRVGWERHFGRLPRGEDWIVPGDLEATRPLSRRQVTHAIGRDMRRLGLDVEAGAGMHSFRRAFVSLTRNAGADRDAVAEITHRPRGDVLDDSYHRRDWQNLCDVVTRLDLGEPGGELVRLPVAVASGLGRNLGSIVGGSESLGESVGGQGIEPWTSAL